MSKFYSRLSYSIGNEDWKTEKEALKIKPTDRVFCITASGDRPLNLMTNECKEIVSLDANAVQNHLLALKVAAMQFLDYDDYLAFLGAKKHKNRLATFNELKNRLNKNAVDYWESHQKAISKGILYQGEVEKLTKMTSVFLKILRPSVIKKLFEIQNLQEQKTFIQKYWDKKWWRKLFEFGLNPSISSLVIEDPGLLNVGEKIKPGVYIYEKMLHSLNHCLANENLLLSLIFQGFIHPNAYSPYLTQEGVNMIKPRLNSLSIQHGEAVSYLESLNTPTFDCFSLSDIASYMDASHFSRLLKAIQKTAKPGARFCIRQFLSSQKISKEVEAYFLRNKTLEAKLEANDRCFIYRFLVGEVLPKHSNVD